MSVIDCQGEQRMPWYLHPYFAAFLSGTAAIVSSLILKRADPRGAARVAAALLAVPPTAFLVWTFARWIRGLDEMQHRIVFEAVAVAFVLSIVGAVAMEGLQNAGIATGFHWEHAWEGMVFFYAAAYTWTAWRYR